MKTIIIGNSGSGKTWLATKLAASTATPVVHLDALFWQAGGFDRKRAPVEVASLIAAARNQSDWVVEGVFGELAAAFMADAELLLWLDLEWAICKARLRARGSESKVHMDRAQSAEGLAKLMAWASAYWTRNDVRSFSGHLALFDSFDGTKARLTTESEVGAVIQRLAANDH